MDKPIAITLVVLFLALGSLIYLMVHSSKEITAEYTKKCDALHGTVSFNGKFLECMKGGEHD